MKNVFNRFLWCSHCSSIIKIKFSPFKSSYYCHTCGKKSNFYNNKYVNHPKWLGAYGFAGFCLIIFCLSNVPQHIRTFSLEPLHKIVAGIIVFVAIMCADAVMNIGALLLFYPKVEDIEDAKSGE